jgi:hypothetical protein
MDNGEIERAKLASGAGQESTVRVISLWVRESWNSNRRTGFDARGRIVVLVST